MPPSLLPCMFLYFHLSYVDSHCKSREFQCIEGTCISNKLHCDGVMDCTDSSDEFLCRTLNQLHVYIYIVHMYMYVTMEIFYVCIITTVTVQTSGNVLCTC